MKCIVKIKTIFESSNEIILNGTLSSLDEA